MNSLYIYICSDTALQKIIMKLIDDYTLLIWISWSLQEAKGSVVLPYKKYRNKWRNEQVHID